MKRTVEVEIEVQIARPSEEVWAFVSDFERLPDWLEEFSEGVTLSDGPLGEGAIFRYTIEPGHRSHRGHHHGDLRRQARMRTNPPWTTTTDDHATLGAKHRSCTTGARIGAHPRYRPGALGQVNPSKTALSAGKPSPSAT